MNENHSTRKPAWNKATFYLIRGDSRCSQRSEMLFEDAISLFARDN